MNMQNICSGGFGRIQREFSLSFFQLEDPPHGTIDLERSFNINTKYLWIVFLKSVICIFILFGFVSIFMVDDSPPLYWELAYLTTWAAIFGTLYMVLSNLLSFGIKNIFIVRFTWILFSLAVLFQITAAIGFWLMTIVYSSCDIVFLDIFLHGLLLVLILFDGMILNRTPIRLKHLLITMMFGILYDIWVVLQSTVIYFNPYSNPCDDDNDDKAIYGAVNNYGKNIASAIIILIFNLFVSVPLVFLALWTLSLFGRRYKKIIRDDEDVEEEETTDVEIATEQN
jgi:hypothetical protein